MRSATTRILLPRDLRRAVEDSEGQVLLTKIVLAVTLRVSALVAVPLLVAIGLAVYEAGERAESIDRSRAEITYTTCLAQNDRHDETIRRLNEVAIARKSEIRKQIRSAHSVEEAEALRRSLDAVDDSKATTVSLIEAIVPYQTCEQIVLDRFGYVPHVNDITGGDSG